MQTLEREWIQQIAAQWPHADLRHDTYFDPASRQILTTDMLVEGTHFNLDATSAEDIGWKSVAVNLSDIAATGGRPTWVLVSIGLPAHADTGLVQAIYMGITDCCRSYGCSVVGGDTVSAPQLTISVTVVGTLPAHYEPGRRHLARPYDVLAVSGPHGLSHAGLMALQHNWDDAPLSVTAHNHPFPQLKLGQQVAQIVPRYAMMDSSDGLADACLRLAEASQVDIILDKSRIQIHPEVQALAERLNQDPMDWVLYGGEDFHLVLSLAPEVARLFPQLTVIGSVKKASGIVGQAFLRERDHVFPLSWQKTFQHFVPEAEPCS